MSARFPCFVGFWCGLCLATSTALAEDSPLPEAADWLISSSLSEDEFGIHGVVCCSLEVIHRLSDGTIVSDSLAVRRKDPGVDADPEIWMIDPSGISDPWLTAEELVPSASMHDPGSFGVASFTPDPVWESGFPVRLSEPESAFDLAEPFSLPQIVAREPEESDVPELPPLESWLDVIDRPETVPPLALPPSPRGGRRRRISAAYLQFGRVARVEVRQPGHSDGALGPRRRTRTFKPRPRGQDWELATGITWREFLQGDSSARHFRDTTLGLRWDLGTAAQLHLVYTRSFLDALDESDPANRGLGFRTQWQF
ncbi:MAG: hypothetical protein SFV23_13660 [Planctomycetaceae bacterium]|nr:hypothetical protein [Planctomycetaceae bacterium]